MKKLAFLILCMLKCGLCSELYRCPSHLTRNNYLKTFRDKCYLFVPNEKYWSDARDDCHNRGHGRHVVIPDQETQDFVMQSLRELRWRKNGIWIGAYDFEGPWKWVTGQPVTWSNWDHDQPGSKCVPLVGCEDCANLRLSGGKWHDYLCDSLSYKYTYICQYSMNTTTISGLESSLQVSSADSREIIQSTSTVLLENNPEQSTPNIGATKEAVKIDSFVDPEMSNHSALDASHRQKSKVDSEGLSTGAFVGIIVSGTFVLIMAAVIIFLLFIKRRSKRDGEAPCFVFDNITYVIRTLKSGSRPKRQSIPNNSTTAQVSDVSSNQYDDLPERKPKITVRNQIETEYYKSTNSMAESDRTDVKSGLYDDIVDYEEPRSLGVSNFGFESLDDDAEGMASSECGQIDDGDSARCYPYDYIDYSTENNANEKISKINLDFEENDRQKTAPSHKNNFLDKRN